MRRYLAPTLVVCLALLVAVLRAQSITGHINGTVVDPSGAVLPGVTVQVLRDATVIRTAVTDGKGEFTFLALEAGHYEIRATLTGFQTLNVFADVSPGQLRHLSLMLRVGALEESVTVSGASPVQESKRPAPRREVLDAVPGAHDIQSNSGLIPGVNQAAPAQGGRGAIPRREPRGTEAYAGLDDNEWTSVSRRPLSTFSVDVDTASYTNIRRFLNQGQLPPADAVRIEEMINYFSYDYPEPRDGRPFAVTTAIDDCPWNPAHRLALIGLQAKRIDAGHMPPRNLVFLIDVSGSMLMPNKLPLVKASLAMLARNLTANDRVGIVVYAGAAGVVLPPTSGADTPAILDAIGRLQAGGSTNGGEGLVLAYKTAREHFVRGGVNRVILATDGDFNVGVVNADDLVRLIEQERTSGITLSVLGFGMGNLKDATMEKLADRGNGNYFYIDSLAEAEKVFVQQAGGTLVTVAKDVKLQVEFNPRAVSAYRLVGYEDRVLADRDFNDDRKDAGDMGAGHSVTALYEIVPAGRDASPATDGEPGIDPLKYQRPVPANDPDLRAEAMTVKLRYKQPDGDVSSLLSVVIPTRREMRPDLGFAAAVAEFGMLLRDSTFKGNASFESVRALAERYKGADPHGHRAEFIGLVDAAEGISRLSHPGPRW